MNNRVSQQGEGTVEANQVHREKLSKVDVSCLS